MPIEIQQALIGFGGSIIGATIGSGIIGYYLNIRKEKAEADKRTYFFVKTLVSNNHMTFLKEADFYNGVSKEVVDNIYSINFWSDKPNSFSFHNSKLQKHMNVLIGAVKNFSREVPSKTLPDGTDAFATITTMTNAARSDDKSRERNRRESDELIEVSDAIYNAVNELDTAAMKELRLSPADIQKSESI